jgi:hypothetical protein
VKKCEEKKKGKNSLCAVLYFPPLPPKKESESERKENTPKKA